MNYKRALNQIYDFLTRSTARIILDRSLKELEPIFGQKTVLEIVGGRHSNRNYRPGSKEYVTLDKSAGTEPDLVADAVDMPFPDGSIDAILCTETIEHVMDYQKLVGEIHRVLKDNGTCVLSTRFLYKLHDEPGDYFRFTEWGLKYLFKDFREAAIKAMGNRFTVMWDLFFSVSGLPLRSICILSPVFRAIFFWNDRDAPSGYLVTARK